MSDVAAAAGGLWAPSAGHSIMMPPIMLPPLPLPLLPAPAPGPAAFAFEPHGPPRDPIGFEAASFEAFEASLAPLPPAVTAAGNFAAAAAAAAAAVGPWTVAAAGPWTWTAGQLKLDQLGWRALLAARGMAATPELLQRLRRQLLQRKYTARRRAAARGTGGADDAATAAVDPTDDVGPAAGAAPVDAAAFFAARGAVAEASVRRDEWAVEGCGFWSLAELQLENPAWRALLLSRGMGRKAPAELQKLRRKMLGRLYAKASAGRRRSPSGSPLSTPSPRASPPPPAEPLVFYEELWASVRAPSPAAATPATPADLSFDSAGLGLEFDLGLEPGVEPGATAELDDELDAAMLEEWLS